MKDLLGSIGGAAGRAGSDAAAPRDVRIEIAGEALPGEGASGGAAGGGSAAGLGDFFAQVREWIPRPLPPPGGPRAALEPTYHPSPPPRTSPARAPTP